MSKQREKYKNGERNESAPHFFCISKCSDVAASDSC